MLVNTLDATAEANMVRTRNNSSRGPVAIIVQNFLKSNALFYHAYKGLQTENKDGPILSVGLRQ